MQEPVPKAGLTPKQPHGLALPQDGWRIPPIEQPGQPRCGAILGRAAALLPALRPALF